MKRIAYPLVLSAAAAAVAAASPSPAKLHAAMHIKPGLWEFDDQAKVTGDSVFADALVAGVPPAQRAQHLAQLRQMIAQPGRERECMSQATFEQRVFLTETGCKRTVVSNAANRLDVVTQCRAQDGGLTQIKNGRVLATSPTSAIMSFHSVSTRGGKTMTVDSLENGRWVSASCGNVHGIQQLR